MTAVASMSPKHGGGESGLTRPANTLSSRTLMQTSGLFPIDGTWERYSFRAGNLLFLMADVPQKPS